MAKYNCVLQIVGVLICLAVTCSANMYIVGDSAGWDISTDLDSWAAGKRLVVGDVLMFQYSSPFSACELTEKGFDSCNTNDVIQQLSSGNATFPLTRPGDYYFADCNRLYCMSGMKMKVHVIANTTGGAPAPAGAPVTAPGPGAAPGPAGELPKKGSKAKTPLTSSAEGVRVGQTFLLAVMGLVSYCVLGWWIV